MPRFLSALRSKNKGKDGDGGGSVASSLPAKSQNKLAQYRDQVYIPPGYHPLVSKLDEKVLDRILYFVSPHSSDDKYRTCEDAASAGGDSCGLCETRDLAACARVNLHWCKRARTKLYKSIRIESIHYCDREDWLREYRRKKKVTPDQVDEERLQLLELALHPPTGLQHRFPPKSPAKLVEYLKLTYQIREGYKANIARIVTSTSKLKYVDLPEGVFSDAPNCIILKQQLMANCPDLRFMKYLAGAEASFARHSIEDLWYNLEAVSLESLELEADVLTYSLARLPNLKKLNFTNVSILTDGVLQPNPHLPLLPAVRTLRIAEAPHVTARGLLAYLQRNEVSASITTLQLDDTGVLVTEVHALLTAAPKLRTFAIRTSVQHSMQPSAVPSLASKSIRQIFFEISNDSMHHPVGNMPCDSYYDYLASSIASKSLPNLRSVRAYCPQFPDVLVSLAPLSAAPPFGGGGGGGGTVGGRPAALNLGLPPPQQPDMPPRLSAQPGSLIPPTLPAMGIPPSMANRMSSLSLGPGGAGGGMGPLHARSQSSVPAGLAPPLSYKSGTGQQRPSSSYGLGYSSNPFSPSAAELAQASLPVPSVPPDIVARLGLGPSGLTIYTKPPNAEEMEWLVTELVAPEAGSGGLPGASGGIRGARPISLMGLERPSTAGGGGGMGGSGAAPDLSWLGDGPKGTSSSGGGGVLLGSHGGQMVGNGFGGYVEMKEGKKGRRTGADWMG